MPDTHHPIKLVIVKSEVDNNDSIFRINHMGKEIGVLSQPFISEAINEETEKSLQRVIYAAIDHGARVKGAMVHSKLTATIAEMKKGILE